MTDQDPHKVLKELGADIPMRLRHAAMLEAHGVREELVVLMCRISAQGTITRDDLNKFSEYGTPLWTGPSPWDEATQDLKETLLDNRAIDALKAIIKRATQ